MKKLNTIIALLTLIPVISFGLPTINDIKNHGIINYDMMAKWYKQAIRGDVFAQAAVGETLMNGTVGMLPNYERAVYWLKTAKRNCQRIERTKKGRVVPGCALAYFNLGVLYLQGNGVPQNRPKFELYTRKAFADYTKLKERYTPYQRTVVDYKVGNLYFWGVHTAVKQDLKKAFTLYRQSAEQGFVHAIRKVALMYRFGIGVPKDFSKAHIWYEILAEAGWPQAQFIVGNDYLEGIGIDKDMQKGSFWISKSALNGNYPAMLKYVQLYKQKLVKFPYPQAKQSMEEVLKAVTKGMDHTLQHTDMRI